MKNQILLVALLATCLSAIAQTKEKIEKITSKSQLDYAVADDGNTKEGIYYIKNLNNDGLWVQGHYKNGMRSGVWYFFNEKAQLTMRYNYDAQKLLFIDNASLKNVSVRVLSDDAEIAKNASAPLPLCPVDYYTTLIGNEIYTNYNDPTSENLTAEITAHIDTKGKAQYTLAYLYKDRKTAEKIIELNIPFSIEWIPSKFNDKTIPSEFTIYANIKAHDDADANFKRFRWDNEK